MPTDVSGAAAAPPILVSLTAFGAAEVRRHGQLWFTRLCHEAGADGVEVRSELLVDAGRELPAIAQAVRDTGIRVVYSSADYLWAADGALDIAALQHALDAAQALGAPRLKMAIGGFGAFVLQFLAEKGALDRGLKIRTLTLPDIFQDHDRPEVQYAVAGLDAEGIVKAALSALAVGGASSVARA